MIIDTIESTNGYPIRLTEERWFDHIVSNKPYMSGYQTAVFDAIGYPNFVLSANDGSKVAVLNVGKNQWLHVYYVEYINEENERDGFITTAVIKPNYNKRKRRLWEREY